MALTGNASKASKAGTCTGSSTDDDIPARQKSKPAKKAVFLESDVSDDAEYAEKGTELCQLGDEICAVSIELFNLPDLKSILSVDTWNFSLTEDEREYLVSFLPALGEEDFRTTIRDLLGGETFHFGSPLADLFDRMKSGLCAPKVARYNESLKYVQRKKHYHLLRNYHNQMVNSFLEMQKSWEDCPESADIEDRLELWKSWKAEKSTPALEQLTPVSAKKGGSVKKPKLMPSVSSKVEAPEERRVEVSPVSVPIPTTSASVRGGSKGVLKMKVIAPKAEQGGGSKSVPVKEIERVHVPAPKGVLKVASKGVQGYAKPDSAGREKAVISDSKRESVGKELKPVKVGKIAKPVKDVEDGDQSSRSMLKPVSEKKKRSLGADRKRKKTADDQEIFAAKQSEPQMRYVAGTPPHEVRPRRRTPPLEVRKHVKSFPKTFHSAYEEARGHEDERLLEDERKPSAVKKKAQRKKTGEELTRFLPGEEQRKKVMEIVDDGDNFEHVEDRRMFSDSRQEDFRNGVEHMDFRGNEVLRVSKKKSKKKAKETKREASPRETAPDDSGERGTSDLLSNVKSSYKKPNSGPKNFMPSKEKFQRSH